MVRRQRKSSNYLLNSPRVKTASEKGRKYSDQPVRPFYPPKKILTDLILHIVDEERRNKELVLQVKQR